MKNQKSIGISLIFILTLTLFFSSLSVLLISDINVMGKQVNDESNIPSEINLKISIPEPTIKSVKLSNYSFQNIQFTNCRYMGKVGSPKIPSKTLRILLPYGKDFDKIEVIPGEIIELEGQYELEPVQKQLPIGSDEEPIFTINKTRYNSDKAIPKMLFKNDGIQKQKGYKVMFLTLFPLKYIPKTGKIFYFDKMHIKIFLKDSYEYNDFYRGFPKDKEILSSFVKNLKVLDTYHREMTFYNPIKTSGLSPGDYDYVIITNDDLLNSEGNYTFQDLAQYKNTQGITTTIVSVDDIYDDYVGEDKQEKIRNFIMDAYTNWGIDYVLLGGDGDGAGSGDSIIPARGLYSTTAYGYTDENIPSDLYYAGLDGNWNEDGDQYWGEPGEADLLAEVYVGRAPVDSEDELSNFVYKTIAHENSTGPYLSQALMVGEDLYWPIEGGGLYKDQIINGSDANGYTTEGFPDTYNVSTLYDLDGIWSKTDLINIIEDGVHIINHLGHSNVNYNMKIYNDDVDALTNEKIFFHYSQGCYNGAFDNRSTSSSYFYPYDSFAEHLVTTPHGAFATIANSRYGFGDPYGTNGSSQFFDREFFDAIFGENIPEIGKANQDSKEDNIDIIDQDAIRWCYYELNLFGDPTATIPPQDTISPSWDETLTNHEIETGESFFYDINASDNSEVSSYWINDIITFQIDDNGIITNREDLKVGAYYITVRAYDPSDNYCEASFKVLVKYNREYLDTQMIFIILLTSSVSGGVIVSISLNGHVKKTEPNPHKLQLLKKTKS